MLRCLFGIALGICFFNYGRAFVMRDKWRFATKVVATTTTISSSPAVPVLRTTRTSRTIHRPNTLTMVDTKTPQERVTEVMCSTDMSNAIIKAHVERSDMFSKKATSSDIDIPIADFGILFRQCAPYIASHRGKTMVIHLPSTIFTNKSALETTVQDVAILQLLGIKIVLVAGLREHIDERLLERNATKQIYHNGLRITDDETLQIIQEEVGKARCEIERLFACGLKALAGKGGVSVVGGNKFFTAKPLGVRNGIDYQHSGEVRKIEAENIKERLDANEIVLLTPLAYAPSGETFYVPSESLSAETAVQLSASKLIFLTSNGEGIVHRETNELIRTLRMSQTVSLLNMWGLEKAQYNQIEDDAGITRNPPQSESETNGAPLQVATYVRSMARGVYALQRGVPRVHLISPYSGSLLKELYTKEGSGLLLSRDMHNGMRPAKPDDLPGLLEIIRPLERDGILLPRSEEQILAELQDFYVLVDEKDSSKVLACGVLKPYSDTHAEVACLAVHPSYRKAGRGELMLTYLEKRALLMNLTHVFILSTRTMQWFEERGFVPADPSELPPRRSYNKSRNSKVYMKPLVSQEHIEAQELWWDII